MARTLGIVGLGVMGRSLALNFIDNRVAVLGWERDGRLSQGAREAGVPVVRNLPDLVFSLETPRTVLLMVTAGPAVDQVLDSLAPLLSPGDAVVDGGNADFRDTARRASALAEVGIDYLGLGVSGGETGARFGPSLMPAGPRRAWLRVAEPFGRIAATAKDGAACVAHLSEQPAAGHFVKMVHNGIEYADMQLIAEAYDLLSRGAGLDADAIAARFEAWNDGPLASYLVEITAAVLRKPDADSGQPLVDRIKDSAEQKGTGRWTAIAALDLGVAAPTIAEAVFARALSARRDERLRASEALAAPAPPAPALAESPIGDALLVAKICAYAQGLDLLRAGSRAHAWELDLAAIARLWRAGCIIRAGLLEDIAAACEQSDDGSLLLSPIFAGRIRAALPALRRVVADAALAGIPVPALSSALAYVEGLRSARLPANLIQAQRDCFGAHQYERLDRPGRFHTADWLDRS